GSETSCRRTVSGVDHIRLGRPAPLHGTPSVTRVGSSIENETEPAKAAGVSQTRGDNDESEKSGHRACGDYCVYGFGDGRRAGAAGRCASESSGAGKAAGA